LEGLEISVVSFSKMIAAAETKRFDPEYFQKQHLADAALIEAEPDRFQTFAEMGLKVDGSAFYPAIEHYYGTGDLPFLRVADVDTVIDFETCTRIPSELCDRFPTLSRVHPGDIVFTKGGSVARIGLLTQQAAASRDLIFLDSSKLPECDRILLYVYAQTEFFNRMLVRSSSQTAQPHLTITLVRILPTLRAGAELKKQCMNIIRRAFAARAEGIERTHDAEGILADALGLISWHPPEPLTYTRYASEVLVAGRLDAEHFRPKFAALVKRMRSRGGAALLGDVLASCKRGSQPAYAERGLPVINSRHVQNGHVLLDESNRFAIVEDETLVIQQGDVLMNGTGVGTIGRVAPYLHPTPALPDNHVTILRAKEDITLDPVFLAVQLGGLVGQLQVDQYFKGSSGQIELYPQDIAKFTIWLGTPEIQKAVRRKVEAAYGAKARGRTFLARAKRAVEIAIEESETAALTYLRES
jgi:type I restriction enzyme, S subunit